MDTNETPEMEETLRGFRSRLYKATNDPTPDNIADIKAALIEMGFVSYSIALSIDELKSAQAEIDRLLSEAACIVAREL